MASLVLRGADLPRHVAPASAHRAQAGAKEPREATAPDSPAPRKVSPVALPPRQAQQSGLVIKPKKFSVKPRVFPH